MKLSASLAFPPLGAILTLKIIKKKDISVEWTKETALQVSPILSLDTAVGISRFLALQAPELHLYGDDAMTKTEVDHWLTFSVGPMSCNQQFQAAIEYLDKLLAPITYLAGNKLTIGDLNVFSTLLINQNWIKFKECGGSLPNLERWFKHINNLPEVKTALSELPSEVLAKMKTEVKTKETASEGKFIELPGAEMGKVVVRFPPEASGYLHIGHAKAALLNWHYKELFKGILIMRFDDTNPDKEKVDFEKVILEDLKLLEIFPDKFTHTSEHFPLLLELCEQMLRSGAAYVDDTPPEQMKSEREARQPSRNRENPVERNFSMWTEMLQGTEFGQRCCVRAKINMSSDNGCMRDPTIYRCKNEPHPRTGTQYKVYPTYDFACPVVDSVEGVTHALRTMEYHDRDEQYYWFIDTLGLRKPHIWEYSRLNMMNTVLSKRKLTWFVEQGLVDSWDDPRFPTVRGVLRRGMTIQGLKQFIIAQGSSRSVVQMEWDKIWAFNKKVIDPVAPRYTALEADRTVVINVRDAKPGILTVPKHPKNNDIGNKCVPVGPKILISVEDATLLKQGDIVTFINWGNLTITKLQRDGRGRVTTIDAELNLSNTDYKKTLKLTWLVESSELLPIQVLFFDHIITKPVLGKDEDFKQYINKQSKWSVQYIGDSALATLNVGDIIQLQRIGFFRVDVAVGPNQPLVLIHIPDGTSKQPVANQQTSADERKPAEDLITLTDKEIEEIAENWRDEHFRQNISVNPTPSNNSNLGEEVNKQGNKVRELKASKASKADIDAAVKVLLALKQEYKSATGEEWKPDAVAKPNVTTVNKIDNISDVGGPTRENLNEKITLQGNKVRELKASKASKADIDAAVKVLLALKQEYKSATGEEWKPGATTEPVSKTCAELAERITQQGNRVRELKAQRANKADIEEGVKILLTLKENYKNTTGRDWLPSDTMAPPSNSISEVELNAKIAAQGDKVRQLKASNADKASVNTEVQVLLTLKAEWKKLSGQEWKLPATKPQRKSAISQEKSPSTSIEKKQAKPKSEGRNKEKSADRDDEKGLKKQTRLGLEASKEKNLSDWYSQVITKGELIEYYDVSGCYILRPWAFSVWEAIQSFLDKEIKKLGVVNAYFPMFVSRSVLEREKAHIADFAPEVAWVTRSGDSELAEHIAIRPTSETAMYPAYSKWIQSHRDLPLRLNQWNNVVRWEFKHPQPFLRTREFLWQEGHTAFATYKEAEEEVYQILDLYAQVYTDLLAVPVIKGRKTEKEKFAGGDYTTTVEAFISASGRGIQGATSHHLGHNFAKMFDITVEDPESNDKMFVYQNSWGLTTRTIGVMIMVHGDNQGLVLPPAVAALQVVIVPCGVTASLPEPTKLDLINTCRQLDGELRSFGLRSKLDDRDNYSPGWKFNHWELKGVPLRIEFGPKDLEKKQLVAVRRDSSGKVTLPLADAAAQVQSILNSIQAALLEKATNDLKAHTKIVLRWTDFCKVLDEKNIILAPFCEGIECEENIKKDSARDQDLEPGAPAMGAKSLCIPFEQPESIKEDDKCIHPSCTKPPKSYTLFGRSY